MARAFVIGASGQIGRALIPRLLEDGQQILALSRIPRTSSRQNIEWVCGDVFAKMPALPELDVIFSLGPLNGFAQWLARAKFEGRPRIVAFGSMSAESKRDSMDPAERALAQTLHRAELQLAEAAAARGIVWTLLRPTMIYGGGLDRSLTPLARVGERMHLFPRLYGATGLRQPVHVDDLADACLAAALPDAAPNRSFDLGGGERIAFSQMLERVRGSLNGFVLSVPIPLIAAHAGLAIARLHPRWRGIGHGAVRRLRVDLIANDEAAREGLRWSPRAFRPDASTWRVSPPRF